MKKIDVKEMTKLFTDLGNDLEKITDNPDGGKVTVQDGTGREIVFTMQPKNKRNLIGDSPQRKKDA